jgi:hypothetical protein
MGESYLITPQLCANTNMTALELLTEQMFGSNEVVMHDPKSHVHSPSFVSENEPLFVGQTVQFNAGVAARLPMWI